MLTLPSGNLMVAKSVSKSACSSSVEFVCRERLATVESGTIFGIGGDEISRVIEFYLSFLMQDGVLLHHLFEVFNEFLGLN